MVSEDSGNFRQSPDKTSKLRKGSGVDGEARGSREEWKWIGSPFIVCLFVLKYVSTLILRYSIGISGSESWL